MNKHSHPMGGRFCCFALGLLLLPAPVPVSGEESPSAEVLHYQAAGRLLLGARELDAGSSRPLGSLTSPLADVQQVVVDFGLGERKRTVHRTLVRVKGRHPYDLLLEDHVQTDEPFRMERHLDLAPGSDLVHFDYDHGGTDLLLASADGQRHVLRILQTRSEEKSLLGPGMRIGEPAMKLTRHGQSAVVAIPTFSARPSYRLMWLDNEKNRPVCRWLSAGRTLQVEWFDQVDVFEFEVDEDGRTRLLLERKRGEHGDCVVSADIAYTPPVRNTGRLLGHWDFDQVRNRLVADRSGNGFHAEMQGGMRRMPGVRGMGIDGVSCAGFGPGELVVPTIEGDLPGEPEFGALRLPDDVLGGVSNQLTVSFWYTMPPTVNGLYLAYENQGGKSQFHAPGVLHIYSYNHYKSGHRLTANALGLHRLFGMIGPAMERDQWNHCAVVLNGQEGQLYINGQLRLSQQGTKTLSETLVGLAAPIEVLKGTWARMDELRIYDYALDLDAIDQLYRTEGQERLLRIDFDEEPPGPMAKGFVREKQGLACPVENIEVIERGRGKALRFGPEGGRLVIPPSLTRGRPMEIVTFAAWVRLPTEHAGGRPSLLSSGNHGHVGMFLGFSHGKLWGMASKNAFDGTTESLRKGEWTHIVISYGRNRLQSWLNGEKVQDDADAYPGGKGWSVGDFTLQTSAPLEVDDVQLFNFAPNDEQVDQIKAGGDIRNPKVSDAPQHSPTKVYSVKESHRTD
jgi:hypothetical protein